ncbi:hypothetical protein [Jiulongibacter sediminis]|uniref:glycoside hydrolase family 19 protein n=1 Tax=Jiulongibacter sediminis TaxID=1605367 RepID=UPI0026EC103D|nr:hypothetical protein [Jiulongibacter sediminis]
MTFEDFRGLFPRTSKTKLLNFWRVYLDIAIPELNLWSIERQAAFLAQVAHECDNFHTMEEYASGKAYEGRADLGNNMPGDGRKFKGRGYIQLTGRSNYVSFTRWYRKFEPDAPDFALQPELIGQIPELAMWATVYYWKTRKLNSYSDKGHFKALTKRINGGLNGYDDRLAKHEAIYPILKAGGPSKHVA